MGDHTFTVGGLKVTRHCSQSEMDQFVGKLPENKKQDVKDVLKELLAAGMISVEEKKPN